MLYYRWGDWGPDRAGVWHLTPKTGGILGGWEKENPQGEWEGQGQLLFGTISWCLPLCAGLSWAWECRGSTCVCLSSGISPCRRDTEGAIQAHLPHSHPTTHTELEVLHLPPTPPITLPHPTLCPRPAETVAMGSLALWLHLAQPREARVGN